MKLTKTLPALFAIALLAGCASQNDVTTSSGEAQKDNCCTSGAKEGKSCCTESSATCTDKKAVEKKSN
jgi:hypothetical protein